MNEFIINPWIIYIINLVSNVKEMMNWFCIISWVVLVILVGVYIAEYFEMCEDEFLKTIKKHIKKSVIIASIFTTINSILPNEKTMYTMIIARYTTKENVEMTKDAIIDFVDYVSEKVDEMNSEK